MFEIVFDFDSSILSINTRTSLARAQEKPTLTELIVPEGNLGLVRICGANKNDEH